MMVMMMMMIGNGNADVASVFTWAISHDGSQHRA
jgi:hypothetical protein